VAIQELATSFHDNTQGDKHEPARNFPPLVIDYNEIDEAINILEKTIKENN